MRIDYYKLFRKKYKKLPQKIRDKFNERLVKFCEDPFLPELNNHGLSGKYSGCRSINITGDIRAIFQVVADRIRFLDIDNHNNLYK